MPINKISDEMLAAFIDGNATPQESEQINQLLQGDPVAFAEFCLASRTAFILEDEGDAETSQLSSGPSWTIAAGLASAISSGAGLSGLIGQGAPESLFLENQANFSGHDDRFDLPAGSIAENSNHLVMDQSFHSGEFNPVQQQYNDTCAIKSQQLILNDFGVPVTEDQLVQQAEQFNIYAPGSGTRPQDVGKLLEINGVHCTQHENATVYDLTAALAQGQKVIIGVDSGELWNQGILSQMMNRATDLMVGEQADHALIVAGIDTSHPDDVQVILTDPGTGEEAARYPMAQFLDAWHDSGNFMVTTDTPAPLAYNPGMIHFDYSSGHIPMIGAMPYPYFEQTIYPLSHDLNHNSVAMELLDHDFEGMVSGEMTGLSPELVSALAEIPDFSFNDWRIDAQSGDPVSFGSSHMADYYNGWAEQHEKMAQYDLDHGNPESAQNHLRYADDCHDHAMDEMEDDNSNN